MLRFLVLLAQSHAQVINASALAREIGVTDKTAQAYLDLLSATGMVFQLPAWQSAR
jgi:predicted AAA+ superfamily ATPase